MYILAQIHWLPPSHDARRVPWDQHVLLLRNMAECEETMCLLGAPRSPLNPQALTPTNL